MKRHLPLRPTLFWEVNPKKLDYQKNAEFIIGRVLDFGNLKEWKVIKDFYGLPKIKKTAQGHIFSDPRNANFWAMIFGIPLPKFLRSKSAGLRRDLSLRLKNLRCTKKPSLKIPRAFSMR